MAVERMALTGKGEVGALATLPALCVCASVKCVGLSGAQHPSLSIPSFANCVDETVCVTGNSDVYWVELGSAPKSEVM